LFWRDPVECLESVFSNLLFHDKLDFTPHHIYKTAEWLLSVYLEWLTGDSAWKMQVSTDSTEFHIISPYILQTQLPRGTIVLGVVLLSDKTNITTMTGARVTHPLLLGLTNIHMCTCMKLSSKAFLLTTLLPIPKYLYPNQ
ncbi:uncharacterized protein BJ212DRAFT_1285292, partial [Suillus subaureus]